MPKPETIVDTGYGFSLHQLVIELSFSGPEKNMRLGKRALLESEQIFGNADRPNQSLLSRRRSVFGGFCSTNRWLIELEIWRAFLEYVVD